MAATATMVASLAACGGGGSGSGGPLKVGVPVGLTGPAAANGEWAKLGVEVALKEINAEGGIDGRQVEVTFGDTELDPTKAVTEMNRLITQTKVDIIIGPLTSDTTLATLPVVNKYKIASIMGSASESVVTPEKAPYSFSWTPNVTTQSNRMVDAAIDAGAESIAVLTDSGVQGKSAAEAMKAAIKDRGLKLAGAQETNSKDTDFTPQLLKLKQTNADRLLMLPQASTDTGRILKQIKQIDWDIPITGSYGTTFADQVKEIAGPDAYDNMNATTFAGFAACSTDDVPENTVSMIDKVEAFSPERAKTASMDSVAESYDAMYLMKAAIEATGTTDGPEVAKWLESNGKSLPGSLPVTGQAYGMSASSHFLVGDESIALVDPGTEVAEGVFQRTDGCS